MRIVGSSHSSKLAGLLFAIGLMGFAAGCEGGGGTPDAPVAPAAVQAKQDEERAAREKAYGKSALPPGSKSAAEKAPKS